MMRHGFTLLEVLLATSMLVLLLGTVWSITLMLSRAATQRAQIAEQQRIERAWTRIFNEDFRAVIQDTEQLNRAVGDENIRHFGVSGTETQLRIDIADYSWRTARSSELRTIFYEFDPTFGLTRRERDYAASRSVEGTMQAAPEIVGGYFRYFDGVAWHDHWSSLDRKSAPSVIEVTFFSLPFGEASRWRSQEPGVQEPASTELRIPILAASRAHEPYRRAQPPQENLPPPPMMNFPPPPSFTPPSPSFSLFGDD